MSPHWTPDDEIVSRRHLPDGISILTASLHRRSRFRHRWSEFRPLPDLVAVSVKDNRYRNQKSSDAAKKRASPVDPNRLE